MTGQDLDEDGPVNVLWFRHGLRLHDNPSLHEAVELCLLNPEDQAANGGAKGRPSLLPVFIFDGESAGTKLCGFNRFSFLLECLKDIDDQLRAVGGRLHIMKYVYVRESFFSCTLRRMVCFSLYIWLS